jgi:hypothetical protein
MPSAPRAEQRPWARRLTLAAITIALVVLTAHPICNLITGCGCSTLFAGGTVTCDIHVPGPPDCPVCTNMAVGAAFTAALFAGWGAAVGFAARWLEGDRAHRHGS